MKISVIGYSGSGKSTLTQLLSDYYQIPKLHLDQLFFLENWQPRTEIDFTNRLQAFLQSNQDWIIDGVFSRFLFRERLEAADQIIFLDFPRWRTFGRILKRYFCFRGTIRPSGPVGCQEKLDWPFVKFVLFTSRQPKRKKMYQQICQTYSKKIIVLHSQKEIDNFMRHLK
ncbi:hypothetical protein [Streptococcus minor]|uniref:hypothetical protein n=1 Tax=Streptococcus minor TaxID=229549 RepID=UPI000377579F|nr:hypothetical protein [Streptococcus minor]